MKQKKLKSCGKLYNGVKKIKRETVREKRKKRNDCCAEKENLYGDEMTRN